MQMGRENSCRTSYERMLIMQLEISYDDLHGAGMCSESRHHADETKRVRSSLFTCQNASA